MVKPNKTVRKNFIDAGNLAVDYSDGDVTIYDNVRDLSLLYPLKPTSNLVALCTEGALVMTVNGKDTRITEGDILFSPPHVKIDHCVFSDNFECKILSLSDHIIQGLLRDKIAIWNRAVYVNQSNIVHMTDSCKEEFALYYALIRSVIKHASRGSSREVVQTLIRALLIDLCDVLEHSGARDEEPRISHSRQTFNRFLNMLSSSEVKRQPAKYYADQLAISPKYLTMLCQQYSDKTTSDWIVQYTLDDIRYFLANVDYTIKEISVKLGFANMSQFGAYVRKHLGMSPSEYRERNGKRR